MRKLVILIYPLLLSLSFGRGLEISGEINFFRQMALSTYETILANNNELPRRFEDIVGLRESASKEQHTIPLINQLAIVPLAPQIQSGLGIENNYAGYKLFAISRTESFDKVFSERKSSGRYSLLIKADHSDIFVMWIPEVQARIIIAQIKDFDPEKEPLAFQELVKDGIRAPMFQSDLEVNKSSVIHPQAPPSRRNPSVIGTSKKLDNYSLLWIVVGISLLVLGGGYAIRRARR